MGEMDRSEEQDWLSAGLFDMHSKVQNLSS